MGKNYNWNMPTGNHPLKFYMDENKKLTEILQWIEKSILDDKDNFEGKKITELISKLESISSFENHYVRKENINFPYMEKMGYEEPMGVMWSLDDDARDLLKKLLKELAATNNLTNEQINDLDILVKLMRGTIFKEDRIIFPVAMDRLKEEDWETIYNQSIDEKYFYIEPLRKYGFQRIEKPNIDKNHMEDGQITLGKTGILSLENLILILNYLPADLTFIDENNMVRYFSDPKERIFPRSPAIISRKVKNCHPPESINIVKQVIKDLKEGKDSVDFWIESNGKFIYIRYLAINDEKGNYKGTLEVTQDVTKIRGLEGEKRLINHT